MTDESRLVAGRYRLTEEIGRGGMGTVWRVQDEVLGRQVALKRLHERPRLSDGELATLYERMRREARSAARIVHPNVVVIHDVVDDGGQPCIVMEYVPAVTLGDLLKKGPAVPPQEAARIGLGMVAALRAAHAAGVLHRDVKPGNVMLGADGRVVLTDFGIAMTADASPLTKTGELVGSIHYMAPERIRGRKPGPASDLWALGATLYQALEGRPPFDRPTAMEVAYAIAVDPLEPMQRAGALQPLIEALLAKDPDERPSAEETERLLRTARTGGSTGATGATGATVPAASPTMGNGTRQRRRQGRKRRVLLSTTVAAAAAATTALGVVYVMSDRGTGTPDPDAHQKPSAPGQPYTPPPLPAGFHRVNELGASFPVPDGWKAVNRSGELVTYGDASGRVGITVKMFEPAGANPMEHFTSMEARTKANYAVYWRVRMDQTAFRKQPAVVWEYTFKGRKRGYRAIEEGFGREGGREYDISLSAPEAQWDTYRHLFDACRDGLTTTGQ
ncbi:serine/threonine-protein kinase [Streptomyces bugieae]|uniref:non-specific serine/threonine protein kinase n=1 Tax=Streptomyces bugieae TaxID=3098223 RepID=A0ABU7NJ61_9ACTN|nr:serine/threonine-protein kinase [Streptomyces sp. DSM 41528]